MFRLSLGALAAVFVLSACTPAEDWTDPEYIKYRMELSDERAFDEYRQLDDEQKATLVPTLIEVYDSGVRQEQCLRALVAAADPRAKDVFLDGLGRTDDALAGLAARGLAAIGDEASAAAVAERLSTVTQHEAYAAFLDALTEIPTPAAADVVAEVMMRPAARIGGISTVRRGCEMLGGVETPSDAALDAMVFGLVNFIPQPFSDALDACTLALMQHGDAGVPKLRRLFAGEDTRANTQLTSNSYQLIVGKLRAGSVLARIGTEAAIGVLIEWFNTQQQIPIAEFERMTPEQASAWYDFHGQLFTAAVQGLARAGTEPAIATIRGLESAETEEMLLSNFRIWFQLSAGAEFGLRTGVHEAMAKVGNETDREVLWSRAAEGTVPSARGAYFVTELRKNALHYLGRTARPGELERYTAVANAQSNPSEFLMHLGYFVLAETCGDEVACYATQLADPSAIANDERVTTAFAGVEDEATRNALMGGLQQNVRTGAVWQLGVRLGGQPAAGEALLAAIENPSMQVRFESIEALYFVDTLPADTGAKLDAFLAENADAAAAGARELRQSIRLFKVARL